MILSIFLAKLIGLYFLIVGSLMALRKNQFLKAAFEIMGSPGIITFAGGISLIFGLSILLAHPIWEMSWRGVITFLGGLSILQGILRMGFASELQQFFTPKRFETIYWVIVALLLVLGAYLTYYGFTV